MCRRVTCNSCSRPTFAGCGAHIEQVLGDVPKNERCRCNEPGAKAQKSTQATTSDAAGGGWMKSLFGK